MLPECRVLTCLHLWFSLYNVLQFKSELYKSQLFIKCVHTFKCLYQSIFPPTVEFPLFYSSSSWIYVVCVGGQVCAHAHLHMHLYECVCVSIDMRVPQRMLSEDRVWELILSYLDEAESLLILLPFILLYLPPISPKAF